MPTITQLPEAVAVTASDLIPISQNGSVRSVSVGTVLGSAQPAIIVASPSLIGRTSLGTGGPEEVNIGEGLGLFNATLAANGGDHVNFALLSNLAVESDLVVSNQGTPMLMPTSLLRNLFSAGSNITIESNGAISCTAAGDSTGISGLGSAIGTLGMITSLSAQDLIAVNQGGFDHSIQYEKLLNGLTIDQAELADPAQDNDTIWSAQASNVMVRQNLSAIWTWITNKLLAYKAPVVELTVDTILDANDHNGRLLICSQPITLTPLAATMGNGFICKVINASSGSITLGHQCITSSGGYTIDSWQSAEILCLTYSKGSFAFASIGSALAASLPGQVTNLTGVTFSSTAITLAWQNPTGVGISSSYNIQYNLAGSSPWITVPVTLSTPTYQLSGLQAGGIYNVTVQAFNAAGSGPSSNVLTLSLNTPVQVAAPAQVVGVTAISTSSSSVQLNWLAQAGISTALSFTVQYRITGSLNWSGSITGISGVQTVVDGLQAGTSYDFIVLGVNTSGVGPVSSIVVIETPKLSHLVNSITWNLLPTGIYNRSSGVIGVNAHISPGTAPVQFGFSLSTTVPPLSWSQAAYVNTDLWGAYVPTPSSAGSWFVWGEGVDGSCITVNAVPFTVQ